MIRRLRPLLWIVFAAVAVAGLFRLRFDAEVLNLLPSELPAVHGLKLYQEHFSNARELVVTIRAEQPEAAEEAARSLAEHLRAKTNLVADVTWQPPWLEHPGQAAELIAYLWLNQPPDEFAALTNRFAPGALTETFASVRDQLATSMSPGDIARLGYDPLGLTQLPARASGAAPSFGEGQELFSSADGTFRIVFVHAKSAMRSYRENLEWFQQLKDEVATFQAGFRAADSTLHIGYTGGPAFVSEISSGMEKDLRSSVGATAIVAVLLFWFAHRQIRPLLWLLTLLAAVLIAALGIGGFVFGTVNVVSIGFAAILLGLGADYGLVLYQEALHSPGTSPRDIRRLVMGGIVWSAITTAGAFLLLNFAPLPGLAQLGSLVAIGVMVAAVIMLSSFLGPLSNSLRSRRGEIPPAPEAPEGPGASRRLLRLSWIATALLGATSVVVLLVKPPQIDHTTNSLRPRNSPAYAAMEEIQASLARSPQSEWLLAAAPDPVALASRLESAQAVLNRAISNGQIASYTLPISLLPRPANQNSNRAIATILAARTNLIRQAAATAGLTANSIAFSEAVLNVWRDAAESGSTYRPNNALSRWIFDKVLAQDGTNSYALGLIQSPTNAASPPAVREDWKAQLPADIWIAGWERLGSDLLTLVERDFWRVMLPIFILLVVCLWLAFRNFKEVLLSLATLTFSTLCLCAIMGALGWSWNLLNMLALPLILGASEDYSIHMQLALRRHGGSVRETRRTIGRALLLCAGTTVAGFGSNAWSSNLGLASLGTVCAVGVGLAFLTSYFLLPAWWRTFAWGSNHFPGATNCERHAPPHPGPLPRERGKGFAAPGLSQADPLLVGGKQLPPLPGGEGRGEGDSGAPLSITPTEYDRANSAELAAPSSLYRVGLWRAGLWIVRFCPRPLCVVVARGFATIYWNIASERREIVIRNLLPALNHDRAAATAKARALFREFAIKVVDLWQYEAGMPVDRLLGGATGWEHFAAAQASGKGVLLLTPHLGNWEFGGPWMTRRNVTLLVITLAEPGKNFTELRQASRARWNIETLVIGNDPFAFLEIIKRLEAGATVALLVDRPPEATAVEVQLFGRKFKASVAAAELARASGCVLLPVYIPREPDGYAAHILPPIAYDRPALRDRENRRKLAQQIMTAFEPAIRRHLDQWFHFIPIWPEK